MHGYSTHSQDLEIGEDLEEPKGEVVAQAWSESDQSTDEGKWPEVDEVRWQQEVDEGKWPQDITVTRVFEWSAEKQQL